MTFHHWTTQTQKNCTIKFSWIKFILNFLRLKYENDIKILEIIFSETTFFKVSVKNLAVPSAVFKATLPVKPSVTITFESPSGILLPSIYPLN